MGAVINVKYSNKKGKLSVIDGKKTVKYRQDGQVKQTPCNSIKKTSHTSVAIKDVSVIDSITTEFENRIKNSTTLIKENEKRRDLLIFILGINIGLRAGDLLALKYEDALNKKDEIRNMIEIFEQKTGKKKEFFINKTAESALMNFIEKTNPNLNGYIFKSREGGHLTVRSYGKTLKSVTEACDIEERMRTHTMRKTFAYQQLQAHKDDSEFVMELCALLNHSSLTATQHYVGVDTEQRKQYFDDVNLGFVPSI